MKAQYVDAKKLRQLNEALKDVTLVPRPLTLASQAGLLNSGYFFVWREDLRDQA